MPIDSPLDQLYKSIFGAGHPDVSKNILDAGRAYHNGLMRAVNTGVNGLNWLSESPVGRGLDAVQNAGMRGVEGVEGGRGFMQAFHPENEMQNRRAAERAMGLHPRNNGAAQAVEDFTFDTANDPVTYVPGLDAFRLAGRAGKALKLGDRARKIKPVNNFLNALSEGHDLRADVTRRGENIVKGHEVAGRAARGRRDAQIHALIDQHADEMNATGVIPAPVRQALQDRAYIEGTPRVRRQVLASGHIPSPEARAATPTNLLSSYLGPEYLPKQRLSDDDEALDAQLSGFERYAQGDRKAGFDRAQNAGSEAAPLSERVRDRLLKGSRLQQYHETRLRIAKDLGAVDPSPNIERTNDRLNFALATKNNRATELYSKLLGKQYTAMNAAQEARKVAVKPDAAMVSQNVGNRFLDSDTAMRRAGKEPTWLDTTADDIAAGDLQRANTVELPASVNRRLFEPIVKPKDNFLKDLSDASRDALFGVSSMPHKKNISILQLMGGGTPGTLLKGAKYAKAIKNQDPAVLDMVKQLEAIGGTEHFIRDTKPATSKIPLVGRAFAARAHTVNDSLDRFETGQRLALKDRLEKKGVTGFDAGGEIRDKLGDYSNVAPFVDVLRRQLGASFPAWHLGVVPRAFAKAATQNPRAMHLLTRAENTTNQDIVEPFTGTDFVPGGPLDEGAEFASAPVGTAKYLGSPSITGPLGLAGGLVNDFKHVKLGDALEELIRSYVPGGGLLESATSLSPFKTRVSPAADTAANYFGSYFRKPPSAKADLRASLHAQGVPTSVINAIFR